MSEPKLQFSASPLERQVPVVQSLATLNKKLFRG